MKNILLFLLLTLPVYSFSQQYHPGDTTYVWNLDGTCLRQQPSFGSGVVDTLKPGSPLVIISVLRNKPMAEKQVNTSILLKGFWIKVNTGNNTGYVFGGDCLALDPFPVLGGKNSPSLLDRFLGEKTGSKVVFKKYKYGKDSTTYTVKETITFYKNGTETSYFFDGCSSDDYYFPSATFTTIYHLMVLVVSHSALDEGVPEEYDKPVLRGVWDNVYEFDGVGALEPQIKVGKKGIRLSLSSCD